MHIANFKVLAIALIVLFPFTHGRMLSLQASNQTILRYAQDNLGDAQVSLTDFNIQGSGVTVNKNANKGIVMTTGGGQASAVFLKEQLAADPVSPGFSTYYVMNVYRLSPGPADGYVFVIAANSNSLGQVGGGLGYAGIANSVGIEFDFYNNGGENIASSDVFVNGSIGSTPGTVFDANYLTRWGQVADGQLVRAFHTWIEYDHLQGKLELRVALSNNESASNSRPTRPTNPLLTRTATYAQISNFFYAGFTAATGGLMQQMALKSWYFSNAYIPNGINPDSDQIVIDNTPPSEPTITATSNNQQYVMTLSGGTDDTGIAGYQYKLPGGNWLGYSTGVSMTTVGEYQARSIDQAGNYSTIIASIWLYQIHFSAGGTIRQSTYRVSTDPAFAIDYEYFDNTYAYLDWYLTSAFTGDKVTELAPRTTSITLYGKPIQLLFTIEYVLNDGYVDQANPNSFRIGQPLLLTNPVKAGHTFTGWYLNDTLTIPFNIEALPQENIVLFAAYAMNNYALVLHFNDDNQTIDTLSLPYQTAILDVLAALELFTDNSLYVREGYTFDGWYQDQAFTQPLLSDILLTESTDLYGNWIINFYQLSFEVNGAHPITPLLFPYQSFILLPESPEFIGHTFLGWFLDEQFNLPFDLLTMPANDVMVFAKWQTNQYSVDFNTNGGTSLDTIQVTYQDSLENLPTPIKEGHTFLGWYLDQNYTEPLSSLTMPAQGLYLYAKWQVNAYPLSFALGYVEGSWLEVAINYGAQPLLPLPPLRDGYRFSGWADNGQLITSSWSMPAQPITLVAIWEGLSSQVIFITPTETIILRSTSGQAIGLLPQLEMKAGYIFIGWSLSPGDANQIIDEDFIVPNGVNLRLYPIWETITNPTQLLNQYLYLSIQTLQNYTYEIFVFTSLILVGFSMLMVYRKRIHDGHY
jgi:uncharacterized repeat protein (TIGR02543 family)